MTISLSTRTLLHNVSYEMELEITFKNKLFNFSTTNKWVQKNNFQTQRTLLGKQKAPTHPICCSFKMSSVRGFYSKTHYAIFNKQNL
jgi:hypothetical protein